MLSSFAVASEGILWQISCWKDSSDSFPVLWLRLCTNSSSFVNDFLQPKNAFFKQSDVSQKTWRIFFSCTKVREIHCRHCCFNIIKSNLSGGHSTLFRKRNPIGLNRHDPGTALQRRESHKWKLEVEFHMPFTSSTGAGEQQGLKVRTVSRGKN